MQIQKMIQEQNQNPEKRKSVYKIHQKIIPKMNRNINSGDR